MIDWMQKHKKYLIVTIWVASVAFVGAGFVGWGSYNLNKNKANAVAIVGDKSVSFRDFNTKYQELFNAYYQASGGNFSQEQADNMNLQYLALIESINEQISLNYANDLGISASANEIADRIFSLKEFQNDGKFDPEKYRYILKQNSNTPSNFEELIKREIILEKLKKVLTIQPNKADFDMINSSVFISDKIAMDIVKIDEKSIKFDDNDTKNFWENNKNSYLTKTQYELETKFIEVKNVDVDDEKLQEFYEKNRSNYRDSSDKLLDFNASKNLVKKDYEFDLVRQTALKTYVSLKNNKIKADGNLTINDTNSTFASLGLKDKKVGDTIKPVKLDNGYFIAKIKNIILPIQMDYEKAKNFVYADYLAKLMSEKLNEISTKKLENFNGKDIGFITRDFDKNIENLTKDQTTKFVNAVFASNKLEGFVILDSNLSVVYKIIDQKLADDQKFNLYKQYYEQNLQNIKNKELLISVTKELENRYEIKNFYNPKEVK